MVLKDGMIVKVGLDARKITQKPKFPFLFWPRELRVNLVYMMMREHVVTQTVS